MLDIDQPVRELVIIGGGAVGCEYASIFRALGTQVTLIDNRPHLVPMMDVDVSNGLADALRAIGTRIMLDAGLVHVTRDAKGIVVETPSHGVVRPDKVLFAAGRVGNTLSLALDQVAVAVDDHGRIKVDDCYRTTARASTRPAT